jgi:hypothetical protein
LRTDWEQYVGQLDETGILEYPCIIGHEPLFARGAADARGAKEVEPRRRRPGTRVCAGMQCVSLLPQRTASAVRLYTILSGRYDFSDWHTHTLPLDDAEDAIRILGGEIQTGRRPIHVSVMGSQPLDPTVG